MKNRNLEAILALLLLVIPSTLAAQEKPHLATGDKAPNPSHLSGTVVDTTGAVIAGATVQLRSANGLFLDEVGDLPMETQLALLRVLQEKAFERVGSNHPIEVDVRLIGATNRDLKVAVADGTFRQDLFYRLNVFPIVVPPLRQRTDDIPLLVEYFVGRFAKAAGKRIRHIGKQTMAQFTSYDWPGNIRELQNVVERAVILSESDSFVVDESWLKREPVGPLPGGDSEVKMIEAALAQCHGRVSGPSGAAVRLGIPRQTLESKISQFGIDKYRHKRSPSS